MDCSRVTSVLVAYHFATAADDERRMVDEHLVSCRECLTAYLALKRAVDSGRAQAHEGPSQSARLALRAAVAKEFGGVPKSSLPPRRPLWTRRIPLYQGVFAAAAAAALALLVPRAAPRSTASAPSASAIVDTSRPAAASLAIY